MRETEAERDAKRDLGRGRRGVAFLMMLAIAGLLGIWARVAPGDLGNLMPLLIGLGFAVGGGIFAFFFMLVSVAKEGRRRMDRPDVNDVGRVALGIGWGLAALALAVASAIAGFFVLAFVTCAVGGEL